MVNVSRRDLEIIAVALGGIDFYLEGALTAPVSRALKTAFGKARPVATRQAAAFVPRALGTARFVAMRHPYIAAAVITYEVVKNREQIAQLAREGWEIIDPVVSPILEEAARLTTTAYPEGPGISAAPFLPGVIEQFRPKRKASAFNKAVSQGMRVVKKSTSYGGKGKISPAKKAFSVVVKLAAAKKKKKKAPKSGIRRLIWNAMKGLR